MHEKTNPYTKFIYKCYLTNQNISQLLQEEKRSTLIKLKTNYENADTIIQEYRQRCFNIWLMAESFKNFYNKLTIILKKNTANICVGKYTQPNTRTIKKLYERLNYEISKNNISE